jgi:DNA-binding HxlR family transcriptional regulator
MANAEFARWSRAVLALLSGAPDPLSSEEIAAGIGECDAQELAAVLEEMRARGLIRPDLDRVTPDSATYWRPS